MIVSLKSKRIYEELEQLQNDKSMQRSLIRSLVSGNKDFFFLNCLRMEFNYLDLKPIVGMPKIWMVKGNLDRSIYELYKTGIISDAEKTICHDISNGIIKTMKRNKLFMLFYCLFHEQKGEP